MPGDKIIPFMRFLALRMQRERQLPVSLAPVRSWLVAYRRFWDVSLDRLTDYLKILKEKGTEMHDLKIIAPPGEPTMLMTRSFDAPRALVWKAMSEREHVIRWFGPHGHKNRVLEFDWRVGGKWKIETTTGDGQAMIFHGEYREIAAPETVTQTFSIEGMYGGQYSVDTMTLQEIGGKTMYIAMSRLPDVESRDGMIASGMETGVVEGFERLDQMLEEFKVEA
jgi:uncharacterized protein YndB with AHSA1/START domain